MEIVEVEWEGEARPDIVAKRVGEDEPNDDQDAPAKALRQFRQWRDKRAVDVVQRGAAARYPWVRLVLNPLTMRFQPIDRSRYDQRHEDRRDDDPRSDVGREVGHRWRLLPRSDRQHRGHERAEAYDCPEPTDPDNRERGEADGRAD